MKAWIRAAGDRLLAIAYRLRAYASSRPRLIRVGRLGTWSTITLTIVVSGALLVLSLVSYTGLQLARFERTDARRTMVVFAAPQPLTAGLNVKRVELAAILGRLRYSEVSFTPTAPGQFRRTAPVWEIYLRANDPHQGGNPQLVRLELRGDRVARVTQDGRDIGTATLEPEILTSVGDRPGEAYRPVRLADVPPVLIQAVLAAEDHRFFDHAGVDVRGLVRAAWANLRGGRVLQGGSTITQQLVKNRLLSPQRTYARKLNEAWLSTVLELRYSKERILEAYLNEIYLGQRGALAVRGIGAAARSYFGKEVHQLTVGEAALLAGMTRAPNLYSPAANPDRARERRSAVLARMRELGMLGDADVKTAEAQPVAAKPAPAQFAAYFTDYLRREIEELGAGDVSDSPGARVYSSLDVSLQRFAEAAVARGLDALESRLPRLRRPNGEGLQAVLIALDPSTGQVRALVGGRNYQASQFNRAIFARRQPGSAFKPFIYLAALSPERQREVYTAASVVEDSPLTLQVGRDQWSPRNYENRYEGHVTVRRALERSLNTAAVRVAGAIGYASVIEAARALGIESPLAAVPSMVLGAFEVTPLELARAYVPFANRGTRPRGPTALIAAYEGGGSALELEKPEPEMPITPAEAYLMTSLLEGVVTNGTGASARALGVTGAVAGKTGTTNDGRDAWFVGYSPSLLTLVWVGFDANESHGLSGAEGALPIWADFMKQALELYPSIGAFPVPEGITFAQVDVTNGRLANRYCPAVARETFISGTEPPLCQEHGGFGDQIGEWWNRFREWIGR
ncbi:MAG TPA: PBP1A family penicillin-binding protein [Methylomirabilota bacterium]|nr:PBP1A family penicillin-binding protein [Methylomirabilota bacterium]